MGVELKGGGFKMKKERGAILILVLLALVTVTILASAFVNVGIFQQRASEHTQSGVRAFYLAESGLDRGLIWLRGQMVPPDWTDRRVVRFAESDAKGWTPLGQGSFLVSIDPDDKNPVSQIKRYTIDGWGVSGPLNAPVAARRNQMIVQTEGFSRFAYFTNDERSWPSGLPVYFVTGDKIEGPTHTNGQFYMYGKPVFEGPVSSVAGWIYYYGGSQFTQPVFREPPQLGVPVKEFPKEYPKPIIQSAKSGGLALKGNTEVALLPDGTMRVTNSQAGLNNQTIPLPSNGVLYVEQGAVSLKGTLKGQLTIGASGDIRIVDSVTYSKDPRVNPDSKDLLGIVAGGNVIVAKEAPVHLEIDASVMALNRSFGVEEWWQSPAKGRLTVYGGIIQANRGIVGQFNPNTGEKLSGYTKDYHYDARLRQMSPPFFPTMQDYRALVWRENKQVGEGPVQ